MSNAFNHISQGEWDVKLLILDFFIPGVDINTLGEGSKMPVTARTFLNIRLGISPDRVTYLA